MLVLYPIADIFLSVARMYFYPELYTIGAFNKIPAGDLGPGRLISVATSAWFLETL